MQQDIRAKECLIHNQVCVAIDMNPLCNTPDRNLCVECLKNPIKSRNSLSFDQASHFLYNKKKAFKYEQEAQNQHNHCILQDLSQNIQELKSYFNEILDQVQQNIEDQVMFIENTQQQLNEQWDEVDIDQFFKSGQNFMLKAINKKLFEKNIKEILGQLFEQNIFKEFKEKLQLIDDSTIEPKETLVIENKSEIKSQKKFKLQFLCDEHQEEVRMYDQNQNTPRENRIICDECTLDRDGPFMPLLTIYKKWEEYKTNQAKYLDSYEDALKEKTQSNLIQLCQVKDRFLNQLSDFEEMLIDQKQKILLQHLDQRIQLRKQWQFLSKNEVTDIAETLIKTSKNQDKSQGNFLSLKYDNQTCQMIQKHIKQLQILMNSFLTLTSDDRNSDANQINSVINELKVHHFQIDLDFKGQNPAKTLNFSIISSNYKKDKITLNDVQTQIENCFSMAQPIKIDYYEWPHSNLQNFNLLSIFYEKRKEYKENNCQTQENFKSEANILNLELINSSNTFNSNQKGRLEVQKIISLFFNQDKMQEQSIQQGQLSQFEKKSRVIKTLSIKSQEMKEQILICKPLHFSVNQQNSISMSNTCFVIGVYQKCNLIVTGSTNEMRIFDFQFGRLKLIQSLSEHISHVVSLCFMNKTLNFASGSWDSTIRIWMMNINSKKWCCEQVLQDQGYVNQIIINKKEDLLISCGFPKQITFWQKKAKWESIQVLRAHSSHVWSISLNEFCNQLVSCGNDSKIIISNLIDKNLWQVNQVIDGMNGFRIYFISNEMFTFQPKLGKRMEIFEMNLQKNLFEKTKETEIEQPVINCEKFFPMVFNKKRQILLNHHGNRINIMKQQYNNEFVLEQSIEFQTSSVYGNITDDGQYIFTYDTQSGKLQIWEQI